MLIFSVWIPLASAEGGSLAFHGTNVNSLRDSALRCIPE